MKSKRDFSERVLSFFSVTIIAAIFDFYSSRRMGRERSTEGMSNGQKEGHSNFELSWSIKQSQACTVNSLIKKPTLQSITEFVKQ